MNTTNALKTAAIATTETKPAETALTIVTLEQLIEQLEEKFFEPLNERLERIESRLDDLSADYGDGFGIDD